MIRWNILKKKMDEAKVKMKQLANREGTYANLPVNLYYKTAADKETLIIYGLNRGETDAVGETLEGYSSLEWISPTKLT